MRIVERFQRELNNFVREFGENPRVIKMCDRDLEEFEDNFNSLRGISYENKGMQEYSYCGIRIQPYALAPIRMEGSSLGRVTVEGFVAGTINGNGQTIRILDPQPGDVVFQTIPPFDWGSGIGGPVGGERPSALVPKSCECGSESAGCGGHSAWCPKFSG